MIKILMLNYNKVNDIYIIFLNKNGTKPSCLMRLDV
jgi:hypothetical protein